MTAEENRPTGPRANDCVEELHTHVGICQCAGYANGWADAMEAIASGKCTHVPPSPGQSLCQCRHQQIEMEYAARIAETQSARSSAASAEHPQEPPC